MSLSIKGQQTYKVVVESDGAIVASVEVPSRNPLRYILDHPRSKYTKDLKAQLRESGCTAEQIRFILGLEPDDEDEAADKVLDSEDRADGSHYLDHLGELK